MRMKRTDFSFLFILPRNIAASRDPQGSVGSAGVRRPTPGRGPPCVRMKRTEFSFLFILPLNTAASRGPQGSVCGGPQADLWEGGSRKI